MRALLATLAAAGALALLPSAAQAQPQIARTCNGSLVCSTWFTEPVLLDWTFTGSPTGGCVDTTLTQDTPGTRLGCIVIEAGETASLEVTLKLDRTAPDITAVEPDRPPDHDGWYSRPVTFAPRAVDPTSGVAGCESADLRRPRRRGRQRRRPPAATSRATSARARSRCATTRRRPTSGPPTSRPATASSGCAGPRPGRRRSSARPAPTARPAPSSYSGAGAGFTDRQVRNGERYRYVLTVADAAGNAATPRAVRRARRRVCSTRRGARRSPARRGWSGRPVRGARYYNVQLFRDGRKILSAWPKRRELQLKRVVALPRPAAAARSTGSTAGTCGPARGRARSSATAS